MTITRIFCDFCKREVDTFGDLEHISLDTKNGIKCGYDVCTACWVKVRDYARSLAEQTEPQTETSTNSEKLQLRVEPQTEREGE